jgi:hypothetical protein
MDLVPIMMEMSRFGIKRTMPSPTATSLPKNMKRPLSLYEEELFKDLRLTHLNHAKNEI